MPPFKLFRLNVVLEKKHMKRPIFILQLFFVAMTLLTSCSKNSLPSNPHNPSDSTGSFTVTVNDGYGSGTYKTGDTVHIFSNNYSDDQLFDKWSGDVSLLYAPNEWHTWFIMPDRNVTVTGSIKNTTPFSLKYEQIMGRDRLKPVYYYFPQGHKGIVYLLHGTGGNAANLTKDYEWQLITRDLVDNGFAVIITESEESTTGVDTNGDGNIRWALLPADSVTNVDYANIRIITDTFYNRGVTDRSKPRYAIGMSDGGYFASALSTIYNFKAAVSYCAPGVSNIMDITKTPIQFCMAGQDDNPSVGSKGNALALANSNVLKNRGICSKYLISVRTPIYPERFSRRGDITVSQSVAVFNELKSKGYIDSSNYYIGYSDAFVKAFTTKPTDFPVMNSLTPSQQQFVLEQINISVADHHIYSDYNSATMKFLNTQCE